MIDRTRKAWRRTSFALVVIASVLLPLSMTAVWIHNMLLKTDRYVATVAPLAGNEDIDTLVATRITDALMTEVDIASIAKEALPDSAQFLAQPLALAVEQFVYDAVFTILESDQFANLWEQANRLAHEQLVALLTGTGPLADAEEKLDSVDVDLSSVIAQAQQTLAELGLTQFEDLKISGESSELSIFHSEKLEEVRDYVSLLEKVSFYLPVLTLLMFVSSVVLTRNRQRGLVRIGVGTVASCLVLLMLLNIGRNQSVGALSSDDISREASAAAFDILTNRFRTAVNIVMAIGIGLWIGAWLIGPGRRATQLRSFIESVPNRLKSLSARPAVEA